MTDKPWPELAKISFDWVIEIMGNAECNDRLAKIHKILLNNNKEPNQKQINKIISDKIGLCLYTIKNSIKYQQCHDPVLVARIYPFFVNMGLYIDILKKIKNIDKKIKFLCNKKNDPFPTFYEIIVALSYATNGWSVEFLPESPKEKQPDIKINKDAITIYIECKFLSKDFPYQKAEQENFLKKWYIAIKDNKNKMLSSWFDIDFKIPIESTKDDCLSKAFNFIDKNNKEYKTSEINITSNTIKIENINNHLKHYSVQKNSPLLLSLIFKNFDYFSNYHLDVITNNSAFNSKTNVEDIGDNIVCICGAKWQSLSEESISKKSRNVFNKLREASAQLIKGEKNIIHIGYETSGSRLEEQAKSIKINHQIKCHRFENNISAIIVNAFVGVSIPDNFECRETIFKYIIEDDIQSYINKDYLFCKEENSIHGFTHWDIDNI